MSNYKIVYKKPTEYDNNSLSSNSNDEKESYTNINKKSKLDDSVFTNDSESDININNIDNTVLKENIVKEITNNLYSTTKEHKTKKNLETPNTQDLNILDDEILLNSFSIFIDKNGFDINNPNSNQLDKLIKNFIIENKLKENKIITLLNNIKLELSKKYNKNNIVLDNTTNNLQNNTTNNLQNNTTNNSQNNTKFIEQYNNNIEINNDNNENFSNYSSNTEKINVSILSNLLDNDINTWLFIGIIFISFIVIIMIMIHKK